MAQRIYKIKRQCVASLTLSIVADSQEDAIAKAQSRFYDIPHNRYDFTDAEIEVCDDQEMLDLGELIEKAVEEIKLNQETEDSYGDAMSFSAVPVAVIKHDYINGDEIEEQKNVDSAYLTEDEEIMVQFEYGEDEDDVELDSLYPDEQMNVLKAILGSE